jgi:hypothetical protein
MARIVDGPPPPSRKTRYPYELWFNGDCWELTRGEDFFNSPRAVANSIQSYARRNGFRASVTVRRDKSLEGQPFRFVYVTAEPA